MEDKPITKTKLTQDEKFEREKSRGAQLAKANAAKFDQAIADRAAEAKAAEEPMAEASMQSDFEKAARGFPHADKPYQPQAPAYPPVQPDLVAPVVTDEVTGGVLPKPEGASRTEGQKEQGEPSVQVAAFPTATIEGDAVQPPKVDKKK